MTRSPGLGWINSSSRPAPRPVEECVSPTSILPEDHACAVLPANGDDRPPDEIGGGIAARAAAQALHGRVLHKADVQKPPAHGPGGLQSPDHPPLPGGEVTETKCVLHMKTPFPILVRPVGRALWVWEVPQGAGKAHPATFIIWSGALGSACNRSWDVIWFSGETKPIERERTARILELKELLERQRAYFATGATLPLRERKRALARLGKALRANEDRLCQALEADLGKSRSESYLCEIGMVHSELHHLLKNLDSYAADRRVRTPLAQFPAKSLVRPCPKGCVLIVSPWNYPVLLTLGPLADALAAGNTAILKPSDYSPNTSQLLRELIDATFPPELVTVVTGGRKENAALFSMAFDHIFFTGSQAVGKEVLRQAAERLVPVTLELGGKSPCIVDETANIPLAARRIVFGKFLNCGQTCVAPDFVLCHERVKERLVTALRKEIARQYGAEPLENKDYGRIVNRRHFDRLLGLIDPGKVVLGGESDPLAPRIAPTVMEGVDWSDPVMGEEIFGPILPILTYSDAGAAIATLRSRPKPLALYVFSRSRRSIRRWTTDLSFGGGCVNDTIIHLATAEMPFGGVGESGMGAYHGKAGFDTFTHYKSLVHKKAHPDLPLRYQPYNRVKDLVVRAFLR